MIDKILEKNDPGLSDVTALLNAEGRDRGLLFEKARQVKAEHVGNKVYLRGLIEFSNICAKDCFYCGIRRSNSRVPRYDLSDEEILNAAYFAYKNRYGSIVMQSGELTGPHFTERVEGLLDGIRESTEGNLRVTLSCGEQTPETYERWFRAGADRYLLRIETSSRELYSRLHPNDEKHSFDKRLQALRDLRSAGFQVGTGVMIGLPFQTTEDLARDLLWMKSIDIDMVGMGPYLEHKDTPLYTYRDLLLPKQARFELSLKMIAILRILMKDINIAASTAMQTIDPQGRERAIDAGANVFMPNITPCRVREFYKLYEDKPCTDENPDDCRRCVEQRIASVSNDVAYDEWGDSGHYLKRTRPADR